MELILKEKLIFTDLKFETKEEALNFLSEKLLEQGYVIPEYQQAILDREKIYPTGIPALGVSIAIPHADNNLVNETTMAIGLLKDPVVFYSMENVETELDVQIIMMLAIKEPHGQIEMLQKVVSIIQDENLTKQLLQETDKNDVLMMLEPYLR